MLVFWQGYGGSKHLAEDLRPLIEELGCELVTMSEWPDSNVVWNRHTWLNELRKADVVIIPCNYETQSCKSNNRLTQSMSLGKPCIVSPLPAYLRIIEKYPGCALVAKTKEEWKQHLEFLKVANNRQKISEKALEASKEFSLGSITKKWVEILRDLEKTDIIIPTYNNPDCLKQCLESIRACTASLYNIVVVDNGSNNEVKLYLESQADIVYVRKDRMTFAQAINTGIRASNSKYVCFLNDDVIVSNGWLENMLEVFKDSSIGGVGPLSNCNKGWTHDLDISIGGICLCPGIHRPHEIGSIINDIYTYRSPYSDVLERPWLAFFCTLIPRQVINKVGLLDEQSFSNSGEDVDFSYRIIKQGYKLVETYKSFVFHYGAVGRHIVEKENPKEYHEKDAKNRVVLNEKWNKKSICIYSGPSWERWDYRNVDSGGIGGSETWQVCLARELFSLGYRVVNFCDCPEESSDGEVKYIHYTKFPEFVEYNWFDCFISSRTTEPLRLPVRSAKNIVMIHDIWLLNGKQVPYSDKVDKFCVLSDWHRDFASEYHGLPKERFFLTANGIDLTRFDKKIERHPYRLIYSSSLDRGLDNLLYMFDFIKAEIPELELHIFYGLDTWKKSAENRPEEKQKIKNIEDMMKKNGVFFHGRIGQQQLAEEMLKSSLWFYPTDFEETHCITAIEAQAAGLPVVASNYAGLRTTVGDFGILIGNGTKGQAYTKECRIEFVSKVIELLKNKDVWEQWSKKGLENVKTKTWGHIAKQWVDKIL
jgi:GT2 family glycosyltransferase